MALLHAKGEMRAKDNFTGVSIIGSEFGGRILGTTQVGDQTTEKRPSLGDRNTPTHAGPRRSLAQWLQAVQYLAALRSLTVKR